MDVLHKKKMGRNIVGWALLLGSLGLEVLVVDLAPCEERAKTLVEMTNKEMSGVSVKADPIITLSLVGPSEVEKFSYLLGERTERERLEREADEETDMEKLEREAKEKRLIEISSQEPECRGREPYSRIDFIPGNPAKFEHWGYEPYHNAVTGDGRMDGASFCTHGKWEIGTRETEVSIYLWQRPAQE